MAGLINKQIPKGYAGQILVTKYRYGYGHQEVIEKLELLDNWYSDLLAYLPEYYGKTEQMKEDYNKNMDPLIKEVLIQIDAAFDLYDGSFEGQSCNPTEKVLLKAMRGIKYRLNIITAKSHLIDDLKLDGEAFEV